MQKRFVNFRSFCVIACYCVFAIFNALVFNVNAIFGVLIMLCIMGLTVYFLYRAYEDLLKRITYIISIIFYILVIIVFFGYKSYWKTPNFDYTQNLLIEGKVYEFTDKDGEFKIIADDLTINGRRVKGKLQFYVFDGIYVEPGNRILLNAVIEPIELIDGIKINSSVASNGIKYSTSVFSSEVEVQDGKPNLRQKICMFIKNKLSVMGDSSQLSYSMITGDRNNLISEISNSFKLSGIAHVLAVSGLHVGFLAAILSFLFSKIKLNRKLNFIISSFILFLYAFFVSTSTVYRATIMSFVGLLTYVNGKKRDVLNALCFSIAIILLLMPFQLFEASFLMSISAVGGIALFSGSISRFFNKRRFQINKSLTSSVSAQIGITPCFIYYFGYLQPFSLIFNILLVPIISIAFQLTIICLIISLILPPLDMLLKFPAIILAIVNWVSGLAYSISFNKILFFAGGGIFVLYAVFFIVSGFVRNCKLKYIIFTGVLSLCLVANLYNPIKMTSKQYMIPIKDNYRVATLIRENKNFYVGELVSSYSLKEYLMEYNFTSLGEFYLFSIDQSVVNKLIKLRIAYNDFDVYTPCDPNEFDNYLTQLSKYNIRLHREDKGKLTPLFENETFLGYGYDKQSILFLTREARYDNILSQTYMYIRSFDFYTECQSAVFVNNTNIDGDYLYDTNYVLNLKTNEVRKKI